MSEIQADVNLLSIGAFSGMAECLKVLAHPVRLCMIDILMQGEFPVNAIAEMCGIKQNQACEHLRLMQNHGLLKSERRSQSVYYKVARPQLAVLFACIREQCEAQARQ